jgi:DNA-binding NtrC family response regulator
MAHILLIDDDELFRKMLRATLEQMGHTVTEARDGKEGLALHQLKPADLVITDLIMPEKEGIEMILALHRLQPGLKIIAMSGGGRLPAKDHLHIAKKLGAAWVLAKPFAQEAMAIAIAELLAVT